MATLPLESLSEEAPDAAASGENAFPENAFSDSAGESDANTNVTQKANDKPATTSEQNQRAHQRIVARLPFIVVMQSQAGSELRVTGYTEDISMGGASIGASVNIPLNTVLAIRVEVFSNGRSERVVATARCVHQAFSAKLGGFRYGLQFIKISDPAKDALKRFVKSRS